MSAAALPRRRQPEGWPWPARNAVSPIADDRARADAPVAAKALSVAQLTEDLRLALRRLEEAQQEARLAAECEAPREAGQLIERARHPAA